MVCFRGKSLRSIDATNNYPSVYSTGRKLRSFDTFSIDASNVKEDAFSYLIRSTKPMGEKCPMKIRFVNKVEAIPKIDILSSKQKGKSSFCMRKV
jgi:hypothetical protein